MEVDRQDGIAIPEANPPAQSFLTAHHWFPTGSHWRVIEYLVTLTLVGYFCFIGITYYAFSFLQVPYGMPFGQMFSALLVNNATLIPLGLFSMVGDLRKNASAIEASLNNQDKGQSNSSTSNKVNGTSTALTNTNVDTPSPTPSSTTHTNNVNNTNVAMMHRSVLYQVFRKHMKNLLILITIVSLLGWFPYFVLDYILIHSFNYEDSELDDINQVS